MAERNSLLALTDENKLIKVRLGHHCILDEQMELHVPLMNKNIEQIRCTPRLEDYLACHDTTVMRLYNLAGGTIQSNGIISEVTGEDQLGMLQWSPHDSKIISSAVMGKSFRLHDVRMNSSVIYERPLAVTERSKIKWNPFIPYWTGVTADEGISIYDLRYSSTAPLVTLYDQGVVDVLFKDRRGVLIV